MVGLGILDSTIPARLSFSEGDCFPSLRLWCRDKRRFMRKIFLLVVLVLAVAGVTMAQTGVKKKRPLPYEYGRVVLNNYSEKAGMSPVVFDHWLHRSKFTCRLCHVDIAFAMKTGSTGIKASDNMKGYYCGTCHNGKMVQGVDAEHHLFT